jgi:hypothetical protein
LRLMWFKQKIATDPCCRAVRETEEILGRMET